MDGPQCLFCGGGDGAQGGEAVVPAHTGGVAPQLGFKPEAVGLSRLALLSTASGSGVNAFWMVSRPVWSSG